MRYVVDRSKFFYHLAENRFSNIGAVAKAASINRQTLMAYLKGQRSAVSEPVLRVAELFKVPVEELFKVENEDLPTDSDSSGNR